MHFSWVAELQESVGSTEVEWLLRNKNKKGLFSVHLPQKFFLSSGVLSFVE